MDIIDVKTEVLKLEHEISKAIKAFETKTDMTVTEVVLGRCHEIGKRKSELYETRVKVELW